MEVVVTGLRRKHDCILEILSRILKAIALSNFSFSKLKKVVVRHRCTSNGESPPAEGSPSPRYRGSVLDMTAEWCKHHGRKASVSRSLKKMDFRKLH